jgi:hypothetical protein
MSTEMITVYVGQWNDREYVYALDFEGAKKTILKCARFGDPSESEYAVGNTWATGDGEAGWRIIERNVEATTIMVELKISGDDHTNHVVWQCPFCERYYSDDWRAGDRLPVLFMCRNKHELKYLVGRVAT